MVQLDRMLKIVDNEIRELVSREKDPRVFKFLENNKKGKFTDFIPNICSEANFEATYDLQDIEVYYNRLEINNNYVQKPNLPDEILVEIFKYLAHHEYSHSLFRETTLDVFNFTKNCTDLIFENYEDQKKLGLCEFFLKLYQILRESYADIQAKSINPVLPKFHLDLKFENSFGRFLRYKRGAIWGQTSEFAEFFYYVVYSSTCFYVFNQWDYLLEKCGENDKTKSLNLIHSINEIFEALIKKDLNLENYKHYLIQLTLLLCKIDYDKLIFENKLNKNIIDELEDLKTSI